MSKFLQCNGNNKHFSGSSKMFFIKAIFSAKNYNYYGTRNDNSEQKTLLLSILINKTVKSIFDLSNESLKMMIEV